MNHIDLVLSSFYACEKHDVPFSMTDVFKNSFFCSDYCRLWNDLPLSIRESNTSLIFRKNLMTVYYDKFNVDFLTLHFILSNH